MKNEFLPVLRFAVCSDSHIEGVGSSGYKRLKKAVDLSFAFAEKDKIYKKLEAFLIAGDITDKGRKEEFDAFKLIYDYVTEKDTEVLCVVAKGHDSINMGKKSLDYYRTLTNQPTDFHTVIGGYHFIGLSTCRLPGIYYTPMQKKWLINELEKAIADTPDKPVFLMHHEHVKYTVYGSGDIDGWGHDFFTPILKNYPNVVDFSGHSHYPLNDPRSLWQNEYTAVGTGSLKYTELTVDGERKIHPENRKDCGNFWIAEIDKDSNLHLMGIDCEAEKVLCEYYLSNPADKNNREYTEEKQRTRSKPPVFPENAEILIKKEDSSYFLEYPMAKSTDGMPVFIYRVSVYDKNGKEVANGKTLPSYYLYNTEDIFKTNIGCPESGIYSVKIKAETAYGVQSDYIEKTIEI